MQLHLVRVRVRVRARVSVRCVVCSCTSLQLVATPRGAKERDSELNAAEAPSPSPWPSPWPSPSPSPLWGAVPNVPVSSMPAVMPGRAQRSSCSFEVFEGQMASNRLLMALVIFCAWDG